MKGSYTSYSICFIVVNTLVSILPAWQLIPDESQQHTNTVGFGYTCNNIYTCDISKGLTCNGICECLRIDSFYDQDLLSCVSLANKTCVFDINGGYQNIKNQLELPCVKNSHCDSNLKTCVCDEHYYLLTENVSCAPKLLLNQKCSTSSDCRRDLGLICEDGTCICDVINSFYDVTTNSCLGKAEHPCLGPNASCIGNATCGFSSEVDEDGGYASDSQSYASSSVRPVSKSKLCRCIDDFGPTPAGFCARGYGTVCDSTHSCKASFKCGTGGTCECLDTRIHDKLLNQCVAKIKSVCSTNLTGNLDLDNINLIPCGYGGHCIRIEENITTLNSSYQCRCRKGFVENDEGSCDLDFGSDCTVTGERSLLKCDTKKKLTCNAVGKCDCDSAVHEYDLAHKSCLGLAGAFCSTAANLYSQEQEMDGIVETEYAQTCITGASCVRIGGPIAVADAISNDVGICKCDKNELPGGRCNDDASRRSAFIMIGVSCAIIVSALIFSVLIIIAKRRGYLEADSNTPC